MANIALNFGNNLVDIAAVTTLVGATTAESLAQGSRGAAGLPWAAMSSFGAFYLIKACAAGSLPAWLREALGINSHLCSAILGVGAMIDKNTLLKANPTNPVAIAVHRVDSKNAQDRPSKLCLEWLYTLDEYTSGIVQSCPSFRYPVPPRVYAYARDGPRADTARDWLAIAATLTKLIETGIMWHYADWKLSLASTLTWAYFFLAAVFLKITGVSREYQTNGSTTFPSRDLIIGHLPTVQSPGQELKILLNVPANVRTHLAWRMVWGFGCIIGLGSTIVTYVVLGKGDPRVFYIWAAFQTLWLAMRSAFYHFGVRTDGRPNPIVEQNTSHQGYRLLSLAAGASWHLAQRHPRTAESYIQDLNDPSEIHSLISSAKLIFNWKIGIGDFKLSNGSNWNSINPGDNVEVDIAAVLGDTFLASVAWIQGYQMTNLDLYDSCVVFVRLNDHKQVFLIPACRVLSGNVAKVRNPPQDTEAGIAPLFVPKLGPCRREDNGWVYWIPLDENRWLYIICDLDSIGTHRALVIDSAEVTRRLELGDLWVSISSADDVKEYVDKSLAMGRTIFEALSHVKQAV